MKLRCAVVDDEFLARQYVKEYIQKIGFLEFEGDYNSPLKVMDQIRDGSIDLLFLDIQMPDITGIEFLKTLDKVPYVIITTAYKEYAIEGYELNVVDYLLKPFSFERFLKAVNKVAEMAEKKESDIAVSTEPVEAEKKEEAAILHEDYLVIRADRKYYKINYQDLILVEGQKAYVTFHTEQRKITGLASLKQLEETLPSDRFIRIHKSYIVARKSIDALEGNMVEVNGKHYPIGRSYKPQVEELFGL